MTIQIYYKKNKINQLHTLFVYFISSLPPHEYTNKIMAHVWSGVHEETIDSKHNLITLEHLIHRALLV